MSTENNYWTWNLPLKKKRNLPLLPGLSKPALYLHCSNQNQLWKPCWVTSILIPGSLKEVTPGFTAYHWAKYTKVPVHSSIFPKYFPRLAPLCSAFLFIPVISSLLSLSLSSPLSHLPSLPLFLLLPCNSLLTHDPPCWMLPLGKYSLVSSFTFFSLRRYRVKILVLKILSYYRRWWRTVMSVQGALVLWTADSHKSVSSERGQSRVTRSISRREELAGPGQQCRELWVWLGGARWCRDCPECCTARINWEHPSERTFCSLWYNQLGVSKGWK